ncbi:hypothetical protein SUGI_0404210 [Cryptomeria japonica]|uniref:uncharacterized protein LOC131077361 isoform X2 n=1 Tax=Cryptomeria japonica TaxID=3369 RepID=UPI002408D53C|nr:uncharacterized protein LOC131077361 isoform X2 [Cryptomeria japonica]GLJ21692.1 hypothetical protein SUGI_0404210 [Cryptomeria japonica]
MEMDDEIPPKEDSIQAFIGYLLEPTLNKVGRLELPSAAAHEEVAKQMRAVVLLYNYYLRKEFPQLEFLDAFAFCKNAVVMCAKLIAYMGVLKGAGTNQLASEFVQRATITEKMVKEACDTCEALESPRTISDINTWPVSKVAVFVVDAAYERCILIFGSVTRGVWSLVEKDVDGFDSLHGLTLEDAKKNKERGLRKRQHGDMPSGTVINDFKKLLSLAFSAVTEQTGLNKQDLQAVSYSLVYSLTKAKTSCQLFMMRCIKDSPLKSTSYTECKWVPVEEALGNVGGALLENVHCSYETGPAVSYFHLWPYSDAIHNWLSRKDSIDVEGVPEAFGNVEHIEDQKVASNNQHNLAQSCSVNSSKLETLAPNVMCMNHESLNTNADFPQDPLDTGKAVKNGNRQLGSVVDTGKAARQFSDKNLHSMQHANAATEQVSSPFRTGLHNRSTMGLGQEIVNGRITKDATSNGMRVGGQETHSLLHSGFEGVRPQNSKGNDMHALNSQQNVVNYTMGDREKFPNGMQENQIHIDSDFKKAAIEVIIQKRDKLFEDLIKVQSQHQSQSKELLSKIATCDSNMEMILRGGTDALILATQIQNKISACSNANAAVEPNSLATPDLKRRKLSEGILFLRSSSQELNDICVKNRWSMPSYFISIPSNSYERDCFYSKVKIRGYDFELEETGEMKTGEMEAKESAASLMLSRLYRMSAGSRV